MEQAINVVQIPTYYVDSFWASASPLIEKAIPYTFGFTLDEIYEEIKTNHLQLWIIGIDDELKAACTTKIEEYPSGTQCILYHCGGEQLEEWADMFLDEVSDWALENGCTQLTTYARLGAERLYPKFGFEKEAVIMTRSL